MSTFRDGVREREHLVRAVLRAAVEQNLSPLPFNDLKFDGLHPEAGEDRVPMAPAAPRENEQSFVGPLVGMVTKVIPIEGSSITGIRRPVDSTFRSSTSPVFEDKTNHENNSAQNTEHAKACADDPCAAVTFELSKRKQTQPYSPAQKGPRLQPLVHDEINDPAHHKQEYEQVVDEPKTRTLKAAFVFRFVAFHSTSLKTRVDA